MNSNSNCVSGTCSCYFDLSALLPHCSSLHRAQSKIWIKSLAFHCNGGTYSLDLTCVRHMHRRNVTIWCKQRSGTKAEMHPTWCQIQMALKNAFSKMTMAAKTTETNVWKLDAIDIHIDFHDIAFKRAETCRKQLVTVVSVESFSVFLFERLLLDSFLPLINREKAVSVNCVSIKVILSWQSALLERERNRKPIWDDNLDESSFQ